MKPTTIAFVGVAIAAGLLIGFQHRSHPVADEPIPTAKKDSLGNRLPKLMMIEKRSAVASNAIGSSSRPETGTSNSSGELALEELRVFDDPSAEQLVELLAHAGWSKEEQVVRFKEAYDQLVRIYQFGDLVADNRVDMRPLFESLITNQVSSPEMRRESRRQYMVLQDTFEEEMRSRQTTTLSNLLLFLGPPPQMESGELRRRLLSIHPRIPIFGPITNFLPQVQTR